MRILDMHRGERKLAVGAAISRPRSEAMRRRAADSRPYALFFTAMTRKMFIRVRKEKL